MPLDSDVTVVRQLLLVEDETMIRTTLARLMTRAGFEVQAVGTANEALQLLDRHKFVAMVTDLGLPDSAGSDLLRRVFEIEPMLAVVVYTGANDAVTASDAFAQGVAAYLVKPTPTGELIAAVDRAIERRVVLQARQQSDQRLRDELASRTLELMQERSAVRALTIGVVEALVSAMEMKDMFLRGHSLRVANLAADIARDLGLGDDVIRAVHLGGRLHDVGKIGIREAVLNKPGRLTTEEYAHVKEHVSIGMQILEPLVDLGPALDYVHHHHERIDGHGYPQGLAGDEISLGGRILAAADNFDALTSARPYRDPLSTEGALQLLRSGVGTGLDPKVFEALCRVTRRAAAASVPFVPVPSSRGSLPSLPMAAHAR